MGFVMMIDSSPCHTLSVCLLVGMQNEKHCLHSYLVALVVAGCRRLWACRKQQGAGWSIMNALVDEEMHCR